jgi:hypothetical protein
MSTPPFKPLQSLTVSTGVKPEDGTVWPALERR